jgi:hypothetical protein
MWKDLENIKSDTGINLERDDYVAALNRHLARFMLTSEKYFAENRKLEEELNLCDPLTEDDEAFNEEGKAFARALLGTDTPEKWKADQITIEEYHLQKYGHLDYLMNLPACGHTKKQLLDHNQDWRLNKFLEWKRREEERRNARETLEKVCGQPVRLYPMREQAMSGLTEWVYEPQFFDGIKHSCFRILYPCEDFPELDRKSTIILDPDWREEEHHYWPRMTSPLWRYYEFHEAKVAELKRKWRRRDLRGQTTYLVLTPTVPGLIELAR